MVRCHRVFRLSLLCSLTAAVLPLAAAAQQSGEARSDALAPVPAEDFGKWERLGPTDLSPDGRWLAAQISRVDEDGELRVRPVDDPDSVVVIANGAAADFSDDGRWLAYRIGVGEEERERLQERDQPARSSMGLLDLETGEQETFEGVASFALSPDGRHVVMRRYAPEGRRDARGVDVVVRELATGVEVPFGNVAEYAWQDEGSLLAMVIDAEGEAGNGVVLWDPDTGRLRPLETRSTRYQGLTWRDESADLAILREIEEEEEASDGAEDEDAEGDEAGPGEPTWADTAWAVVAFRDADDAGSTRTAELTAETAGFPTDHRVVPWEGVRWSEDGERIYVGIQPRRPDPRCEEAEEAEGAEDDEDGAEGGEPCPDEPDEDLTVEIWHADDIDIVPRQKVRANFERRENDLSVWHLDDDRFVRLEDEVTEDVRIVEGVSFAVGTDQTPYERQRMFGPELEDVYLVDLETGEKERVLEGLQYFFGPSPEGGYLLYLEDDHYWTHDVESGERVNLTGGLPSTFVDLDDDRTVEQKRPFNIGGWLEDDGAVLIYDEHDIWRVAPDGSSAARITDGAAENLRHRLVRMDFDVDAFDPDSTFYVSLYDDWEETWGYGRIEGLGSEVERLTLQEARVSGLSRADDADVYMWRVQDFEDSPDVFVGNADLEGEQITRTNPFQDDYAWGRSELVSYTNEWGDTLQGSLYYPAGWEAGRQYPMITYIYEIRSNQVRSYHVPSEEDYYNFQSWVQDGYFVFQPDIVYRDRDPGVSAVVNIVPAVEAVIETGMVDPDAIGLIGHSWGGYQTTFFVTQSDLFAAAVAGAPLTNMFSMYLSIYWNTGGTDARIFEISQGRLEVPFWEDEDAYHRNSPVFHIENMETPLLMAQGTEDGAVDFNQGVEFYNAARRADKDFVFIVYNDENHGFAKEPNRRDYHRRIDEWFAHYLKGEPAPAWILEGVPFLEQPGGQRGR